MNRNPDQKYKKRVYDILELTDPEDRATESVNFFLMALVLLNILAVILETVESVNRAHAHLFQLIGEFSIVVFTAEYLLRMWACNVDEKYRQPIFGRLRYATTAQVLIDLAVILPFYLVYVYPNHRFLRSLRVFWAFRLLKLSRYSQSLKIIINVVKAQQRELAMSFSAIIFFMVLSSTIVYFLEHDAQPHNFPSIPETMWWAVLIMTTIGVNVYPVITLGKVIGGLIIILGVATFALPTAILTSGFVDELERKREEERAEDEGEP